MREIANLVLVFLLNLIASRGAPPAEARVQRSPECAERVVVIRPVDPPLMTPPPMLLTAPRPDEALAPSTPCVSPSREPSWGAARPRAAGVRPVQNAARGRAPLQKAAN